MSLLAVSFFGFLAHEGKEVGEQKVRWIISGTSSTLAVRYSKPLPVSKE
jgi:hypothetical protein